MNQGWLALTRRPGESINIGQNIEVAVVGVERNKVRLAIRAPRSVKVLRSEIADRDVVVTLDLGLCPHCESAAVEQAEPKRLRCQSCRATWVGIRRKLAA